MLHVYLIFKTNRDQYINKRNIQVLFPLNRGLIQCLCKRNKTEAELSQRRKVSLVASRISFKKTIVIIFIDKMKLVTAEAYIDWFTETMALKVEPKFQIESWGKETVEKLYQARMIGFLQKFDGYSEKITKDFIDNFNQDQTRVGDVIVPVTQEYLSQALDLPMVGEKYHKGLHFKEKAWTFFLEKNQKGTFDRTKGIPREWFSEPWVELVMVIQKFLTCDRGYIIAHLYHVRLLQHIKGEDKINLPYFLYKSLLKMIETVKLEHRPKPGQVYHQGLIKILVEYKVRTQGIVWGEFLSKNHFVEQVNEIQNNPK